MACLLTAWSSSSFAWALPVALVLAGVLAAILLARASARTRRRYRRVRVLPYRGDDPELGQIVRSLEALHRMLQRRWWRRLLGGQPSIGLEVHCDREAWIGLTFPEGLESSVQAMLREAYPSCRLVGPPAALGCVPYVLRLRKHASFALRAKRLERFAHERSPSVNSLIVAMAACDRPVFVQLALTPAPALFESHAKRAYRRRENRLARARKLRLPPLDPSIVEREELVGGLELQHCPLFFADLRVVAPSREVCEKVASRLRAGAAENRLVERGTSVRHRLFGLYSRRVRRGEGNPLPSPRHGVLAAGEIACIWHLPSVDFATVPFERSAVPVAPASPAIMRTPVGALRDCSGPVSIHPVLRGQNTAVSGTAEQGKSSYLLATVAEDLRRERCAVIVLDPKGEVAEAAVGIVPEDRVCTLLPLNDAPRVDFDRIIERREVLVVKGALGEMGAGNTSILMRLLLGMLDAALARRQDDPAVAEPVAVALKIDEASFVIDRGFTETMALRRSAGLETVACWRADAQWLDRAVRNQLEALFDHRVYFATASVEDSRAAASLLMASFSDVVRPDLGKLAALGRPDVRLHLPRHFAIASWVTPEGRQPPFVAQTRPIVVDRERVAAHARRQAERGARDLEQRSLPRWERTRHG